MSFNELAITIVAQNLASAEFSKVASDAGAMASRISSKPIAIHAENFASPEINRVAEDAARAKGEVEASPIALSFELIEPPSIPPLDIPLAEITFGPVEMPTVPAIEIPPVQVTFASIEPPSIPAIDVPPVEVTFAPIEVPSIPPIDVPPIPPIDVSGVREAEAAFGDVSMSAAETGVSLADVESEFGRAGVEGAVMGESVRESANGFVDLQVQAEATTISLTTVARAFTSVTSVGSAVISLAGDFGIVDKESAKWARTILVVITLAGALIRLKSYLTTVTTGHTAAIAINTTAESANATQSILLSVAYKIKAAATWIATAAQNALNISQATFLALTGIGIGVIIAAAVAMAYFASQMNAATSSVQSFNEASAETSTRTRGITRAGEQEMYRRGVE